jgi:predicted secreted protein
MQRHTNRLIVATVLIAAGVIGGFFVFEAYRKIAAVDAAAGEVSKRVEQMIATAGDIASAQQAYVAPGQAAQPWLEQSAMLLQQLGQDVAAIRPLLQSTDGATALDDVDKQVKSLVVIDGKARQDLEQAEDLLAADLIFSEGHEAIRMLVTALRGLVASEQHASIPQRALLERQQWGSLGGIAIVWIIGLLVLVPLPVSKPVDSGSVHFGRLHGELTASAGAAAPKPAPATVDLEAAADVCAALARTTDAASLQQALGRAATVLDARGVIIWMGAGEELFPALSFGYDDRVIERLGPIPRKAANATADAWRTAQLRTVAGDVMAHGAIAAPVHGIGGCVGVFAAEVRNAREQDPGTRAVAAMIAAQLAGIVSAWPAASAADVHKTA